eukprot:4887876-Amphidinium_carterae.1
MPLLHFRQRISSKRVPSGEALISFLGIFFGNSDTGSSSLEKVCDLRRQPTTGQHPSPCHPSLLLKTSLKALPIAMTVPR